VQFSFKAALFSTLFAKKLLNSLLLIAAIHLKLLRHTFCKLNHMKYLFIYLGFIFILTSCDGESVFSTKAEKAESEKKISKRDVSITSANSYSDLFFDSSAVEKYIADNQLNDSVTRRMRSFYNARNYQFAWFTSNGLTEQARGFWNLHDYVSNYNNDSIFNDKKLQNTMERLIAAENLSVSASDKNSLNTELKLTHHFIHYVLNNFEKGYVKRKEMERFVPRKKEDVMFLADSLLNKKHNDDKYFEDVHARYGALKNEMGKYLEITKQGGWPLIEESKSIKKGTSSPVIAQIKRRLQISGDMPAGDTTQVYNDSLELAVKNFQLRHGYKPDGTISAAIIKEMNVPAAKRLQQIVMNMERMRWMPNEPKSDNLILVNIPEFMLHMYEGNQRVWDMVVVVGKEGHNTVMFTGDLNQIVFSPYWNVPPSIVREEILPAVDRNPNYLASQNMEIVKSSGDLPTIRQKPGTGNALGKVKFLFPNSFNIYFHDTPSKSLFDRDKRAFSHGCIRLQDPFKMAQYLLRNNSEWTPDKINAAMNAGSEKYVKLKDPVPVFITYYTSWVDDNGLLNFRDDIYKHDDKLSKRMFVNAL
jgi:L,D-transpeptidase YcbB